MPRGGEMIHIAWASIGTKVITPLGHVGRIEGVVIDVRDTRQFYNVRYLDPSLADEPVAIFSGLLRPCDPTRLFPDELERLQRQYADPPKKAGA